MEQHLEDSRPTVEHPDGNFGKFVFSIIRKKTWLPETGGGRYLLLNFRPCEIHEWYNLRVKSLKKRKSKGKEKNRFSILN